jgi:hypothetical protein
MLNFKGSSLAEVLLDRNLKAIGWVRLNYLKSIGEGKGYDLSRM